MRCVHWNRIGEQCPDQALQGKKHCTYHSRILDDYDPDHHLDRTAGSLSRFPTVFRLAAIVLLLILLFAAFQTLLR